MMAEDWRVCAGALVKRSPQSVALLLESTIVRHVFLPCALTVSADDAHGARFARTDVRASSDELLSGEYADEPLTEVRARRSAPRRR